MGANRPPELQQAALAHAGQVPAEVRHYLCHVYHNKAQVVLGMMEIVRQQLGAGELSDRLLTASKSMNDLEQQLKPFMGEVTDG